MFIRAGKRFESVGLSSLMKDCSEQRETPNSTEKAYVLRLWTSFRIALRVVVVYNTSSCQYIERNQT